MHEFKGMLYKSMEDPQIDLTNVSFLSNFSGKFLPTIAEEVFAWFFLSCHFSEKLFEYFSFMSIEYFSYLKVGGFLDVGNRTLSLYVVTLVIPIIFVFPIIHVLNMLLYEEKFTFKNTF